MRPLGGPLLVAAIFLAACGGPPSEKASVKAASDRQASEDLRRDLAKLRSTAVPSECDVGSLRASASRREKAEVWGKDNAPPGLPSERVEAFLCRHRTELESSCWARKFESWERSEIEYGLVVDPSGAVLGGIGGNSNGSATAALERGGARVSSPELARCVETVVASWKFPEAAMPTWMTLNFRF